MKKRLLVVEDNARLLSAIVLCLRKAGYEVMTARDGKDALINIAETIPDLIVSDIMMPGFDGFSLALKIRENPRTDLIPIIFLTAKDSREDRIASFRIGVDAYLVKPFEPEELIAAIENILNRVARTHARVARAASAPTMATTVATGSATIAPSAPIVTAEFDLTDAEERVANLVAESLSNKEIAARLDLSVRTIEMHISHILSKKGWSNRVEIARYMIERSSLVKIVTTN
jgi:DNA-binding NarL/FixJ family response regulator